MNSEPLSTPSNLAANLRDLLNRTFDTNEMHALAFDLKLDYDDIPGQGKPAKTVEFIQILARQKRIPELIERCQTLRPQDKESWQSLLEAAKREPLSFAVDYEAMGTAVSPPPPTPSFSPLQNKNLLIGIAALALIAVIVLVVNFWPDANSNPIMEPADIVQGVAAEPKEPEIVETTQPANSASPSDESASPTAKTTGIPEPTITSAPSHMPSPTSVVDTTTPPEIVLTDSRLVRPTDGMEMVFVPAGTFLMGSDPNTDVLARDDEIPQHEVTLDSFWIDRTEVTNAMYKQCEAAGACNSSSFGDPAFPVVSVSWFDAQNYCVWAGGALPTESQWEYAARGNDGRIYPWGNEALPCDLVGGCGENAVAVATYSPASDSWVGAADMSGNVWEWVADWYDFNYYENSPSANPTGPSSGQYKVVRGGNYSLHLRITYRDNASPYEDFYSDRGFRCALPAG